MVQGGHVRRVHAILGNAGLGFALIPRTVFMGVAGVAAGTDAKIDVRIVAGVGVRFARADLEAADRRAGAVHQMMAIGIALRECRAFPGVEDMLAAGAFPVGAT